MTKGWKIFWIVFDTIFFGGYFLYLLALADPAGFVRYYDGRFNTSYAFMLAMGPVFYWWLTLIVMVCFCVRLYFCKLYFASAKAVWIARSIVIVCNPITALILSLLVGVSFDPFLKGYRAWAQSDVQVEAIRDWMATVNQEAFEARDGDFIKPSEKQEDTIAWPDVIVDLDPHIHSGCLFRNDEGQNCLRLWNGGGFGHWGIVIGPKEMRIDSDSYGGQRLKVEEGVYVWSE